MYRDAHLQILCNIWAALGGSLVLKSVSGRASSNGNNTVIPAVAGKKLRVYAYSFSTPSTTAVLAKLTSGNGGTELWRMSFQAPSSVIVGANLASAPPGALFESIEGQALVLNMDSAQTIDYAFSYWEE